MSVRDQIRKFILNNFLFTSDDNSLNDRASLLATGILDSTGMLELIMHLEETYAISVLEEEMVPANLDSVQAIVAFLERKRAT